MLEPQQQVPRQALQVGGCLVLFLFFFFACLVPFILVDFAQTALTNLHLSPVAALLVLLGMLLGSPVNIPVARFPTDREVVVRVFEPVAGLPVMPRFQRLRQEAIVAVNLGGCIIPVLLSLWLLQFIVDGGAWTLIVLLLGIAVNSFVCYRFARPVKGLGIALPFFLPALVALLITWVGLSPPEYHSFHAPVAFVIGVTGPLIGADLLHWKDLKQIGVGTMSIGGAGTWDGIVLSGLMAAFLAGL